MALLIAVNAPVRAYVRERDVRREAIAKQRVQASYVDNLCYTGNDGRATRGIEGGGPSWACPPPQSRGRGSPTHFHALQGY